MRIHYLHVSALHFLTNLFYSPSQIDGMPVEATRTALVSFYKAHPTQRPHCFHGIECRIINVSSGLNAGKTAAVCGLPMGEDDCTFWCKQLLLLAFNRCTYLKSRQL